MTRDCFEFNMSKFEKMHGVKAFPVGRKQLILERMKSLSDTQFARVCDEIAANHNSLPTLKLFYQYADDFLEMNASEEAARNALLIEERRRTGKTCDSCDDFGLVTAISRTIRYSFAFGCPEHVCMAREFFHPTAVRWEPPMSAQYRVILSSERLLVQNVFEDLHGKKPARRGGENFTELLQQLQKEPTIGT